MQCSAFFAMAFQVFQALSKASWVVGFIDDFIFQGKSSMHFKIGSLFKLIAFYSQARKTLPIGSWTI